MEDYDNVLSPAFTISTARGEAGLEDQVSCYAEVSEDFKSILCVIRPEDGELLAAGTQYVYDVEISKESEPYDIVHTLLTGTVAVTDQVTGAGGDQS